MARKHQMETKNTFVEVWDLKNHSGDCSSALRIFSSDISYGNLIKCTTVKIQYPEALIGKSNGSVDVWDVKLGVHLRRLSYGPCNNLNREILITNIVLTNHYIIVLNSDGRFSVWDKEDVLSIGSDKLIFTDPLWSCKGTIKQSKIVNIHAEDTKIVTEEKLNCDDQPSFLVVYDFWVKKNKSPDLVLFNKRQARTDSIKLSGSCSKICKFC